MSRSVRLLVILAAWALPVVWLVAALAAGPSDGSVVWSSPLTSGERWDDRLVVRETYGDTPLRVGDEIVAIGGQAVADLLAGERTVEREGGHAVAYRRAPRRRRPHARPAAQRAARRLPGRRCGAARTSPSSRRPC